MLYGQALITKFVVVIVDYNVFNARASLICLATPISKNPSPAAPISWLPTRRFVLIPEGILQLLLGTDSTGGFP